MAKQCERPGCKEPAIAAYFLDSAELLMTLENYIPVDGMQVNGLCRLKNENRKEDVVVPIAQPEVVAPVEVELEETKAIPWSPQFDQTDDLGGVLRPKGRLLSRAFNFDDTNADGLKREPFDENDIP